MATLKEHQNAMVDLLANGSAIPASAARLAHALHDVLSLLLERDSEPHSAFVGGQTATADFINDVRFAADLSAVPERGSALIANLRAELVRAAELNSVLVTENNELKAACDALGAEVTKRAQDYDDVKEALRTQREVNDRLQASLSTWELRA